MVIRIRFGRKTKVVRNRKNQRLALTAAALLTPAAALAFVLSCWRLAADLGWTSNFAIPSGFFSHWQVWLGAAVLLQACARVLNRYGRDVDTAASQRPGL